MAFGILVVSGLFLAIGAATPRVATHAPGPALVGSHAGLALAHSSSAPHPGAAATVAVTITNPVLPVWSTPGSITLNFTVATIGVDITARYTNASVDMLAELGPSAPYVISEFANWKIPVADGQTSFTTSDSNANVLPNTIGWVPKAADNASNGTWLPSGRYIFIIFVTATNHTSGAVGTGSAETSSAAGASGTQVITWAPTAALNAPSPTGNPISPGNYTVVASYGGDWITSATVNITGPTGIPVFDVGIWQPGVVGDVTTVVPGNWLIVTPGVYHVVISSTTSYTSAGNPTGTYSWGFNLTVTNGVTAYKPVYVNQTTYTNTTGASTQLFGGWSPQQASATLMVIGVIIGLIVALVLGRMMWGTTPTAAPAQPWSGSKSGTECSVCHQTFASEAEMKEHTKTAHGMS